MPDASKILVIVTAKLLSGKKEATVPGNIKIDIAKITGITPAEFTLIGICVDCPPYTLRPTTRFAYCTGILL